MSESQHTPVKALVTGGAGFLGSFLCERLLKEGRSVICVDNFHTGSRGNIDHLLVHPHFTLITHDVCEPLDCHVQEIYHLACPASPKHYQADPIKTLKTSVIGSINMLELAKKNNARVLLASTSEIYGDPERHPQSEDYFGNVNPLSPRACYDEGKRCAETLFMDYQRVHGIGIKIARIFNTYGPRMHPNDGRVVSNFIVQALKGENLTIYGKGSQTRSFCYMEDLIEGLYRLMLSPRDFVGPVNLGNPHEIPVSELAEKVLKMTDSTSEIAFFPLPADDPKIRCPDITTAQLELDWEPRFPLEVGLEKTVDYFSALLSKAGLNHPHGIKEDKILV